MLLHLLIISSYCRVGRDYKTSTVVHSPVDGHLSCFKFQALVNNVVNIYVRVFAWICIYFSLIDF